MTLGRWTCGAWLGLMLAVLGCKATKPTPAEAIDEVAVKEYQAVLEKQIGIVEELAAILKTVDEGAASRENAKVHLLELSAKNDKVLAEFGSFSFKDFRARNKIESEAATRVVDRFDKARTRLYGEIARINKMEGGQEFFQKDVRQIVEGLKRQ